MKVKDNNNIFIEDEDIFVYAMSISGEGWKNLIRSGGTGDITSLFNEALLRGLPEDNADRVQELSMEIIEEIKDGRIKVFKDKLRKRGVSEEDIEEAFNNGEEEENEN